MSNPMQGYGEGRDPIPAVHEPTVVFMINRTYRPEYSTVEDIYNATRCGWVIGEDARNRAVYALGVAHGVVRGAFRIDRWTPVEERRWCFEGCPAPELGVVGTSFARLKAPQGHASPVRLFLNGIQGPAQDGK
jgi:hypothetical protein